MRLEGSYSDVKTIENVIIDKTLALKKPSKTYDKVFDVKSVFESFVYDVIPQKEAMIFSIRFTYDGRNQTAWIDIKDKYMQSLYNVSLNMNCLVRRLTPQKKEQTYSER